MFYWILFYAILSIYNRKYSYNHCRDDTTEETTDSVYLNKAVAIPDYKIAILNNFLYTDAWPG